MRLLAATLVALLATSGPVTIDFGGQRPPQGVQVSSDLTWTQDSSLTLYDPASTATVVFQLDPGQNLSTWQMKVTDRVSMTGGGEGTVFPTFTLNGRNVPAQAIPWYEFNTTAYPVGQFLKPGRNVLQITASVTESVNEYQIDKLSFGP